MKKWVCVLKNLAISIGIVGAIALVGTLMTDTTSPWYLALEKPGFQPPPWVFIAAWSTIYLLSAWALYLLFDRKCGNKEVYWPFTLQGVFHLLWILAFFQLHLLGAAMVVLVFYFAAVFITLRRSSPCLKGFAWLFVPHLVWLLVAMALNYVLLLIN